MDSNRSHPGKTLGAWQLSLLIVILIAGPIGCGLLLSYFTRRMPEPSLAALVRLESKWIPYRGDANDPRLVPCITVKNPTDLAWRYLSVGINEQFYCGDPKGIPANEVVSLPLEHFVARNGSVPFPVGNRDIRHITVFAQLPSGARVVSEYKMLADKNVRAKDEKWSEERVEPEHTSNPRIDEGWVVAEPK